MKLKLNRQLNQMNHQNKQSNQQDKLKEQGRVIAQGMRAEQVQHEKNMAKSEKRTNTMLERAAEKAISGGVDRGSARTGSRN